MQGLIYGVKTSDPATLAGVCGLVALATAAACLIPVWRALRVDPMRALRWE
jgi:putative ABC transport system permease protein